MYVVVLGNGNGRVFRTLELEKSILIQGINSRKRTIRFLGFFIFFLSAGNDRGQLGIWFLGVMILNFINFLL